ncbi:hypothetical protein M514_16180 [Trichuris suis]|uniref:Uncharacterized protein n=1 Tax=Trichuris suis TaxID=68888 RepID=A0A085NQB4_9BILA|nr:hypothetical protein M514_16180 [Trichuris suis]
MVPVSSGPRRTKYHRHPWRHEDVNVQADDGQPEGESEQEPEVTPLTTTTTKSPKEEKGPAPATAPKPTAAKSKGKAAGVKKFAKKFAGVMKKGGQAAVKKTKQGVKAVQKKMNKKNQCLTLTLTQLKTGHERPESYGIKVLFSKRDFHI